MRKVTTIDILLLIIVIFAVIATTLNFKNYEYNNQNDLLKNQLKYIECSEVLNNNLSLYGKNYLEINQYTTRCQILDRCLNIVSIYHEKIDSSVGIKNEHDWKEEFLMC